MDDFYRRVARFLGRYRELSLTSIGEEAVGDPRFLHDVLRPVRPRSPQMVNADRLLAWMAEYERSHPIKPGSSSTRKRRAAMQPGHGVVGPGP